MPLTPDDLAARLGKLPRAALAHLPTPLDDCPRAADALGLARLRIKRDDATGLAFGGNKVRHHEYILGDALESGYDCVIQGAASQSNHSRQLAAACAKLGLEVHLTPKLDAHSSPVQGNYLITQLFGATMHKIGSDDSSIDAKERIAEQLRAQGRRPYVIGMGAERSLVLAAVAYVGGFLEILGQAGVEAMPEAIFSCSQGSTQAGLLVAARALDLPVEIVGINPMDDRHEAHMTEAAILELANYTADFLDLAVPLSADDVVNLTDYSGEGGYGTPTAGGRAATALLGRSEGVLLDPVYTAKAFAGLIEQSHVRGLHDVMFVHTGGLPALFAYADDVLTEVDPTPSTFGGPSS